MQGARATISHQRAFTWIVAALHRHRADCTHHGCSDNIENAERGALNAELKARGQRRDGAARRLAAAETPAVARKLPLGGAPLAADEFGFLELLARAGRAAEEPEALASRELEEEAGLRAERFTYLGKTYPGIGYSNEVIHLFLAEGLSEGEAGSDDDEFVDPVRMPFAEAVRRARAGEILDAKSCVAILLAQAHLDSREA